MKIILSLLSYCEKRVNLKNREKRKIFLPIFYVFFVKKLLLTLYKSLIFLYN